MESGKRVRVSSVVEYNVPPTFRVTGPPKEGGEEDTGGGEILGNIGGRQGEGKSRFSEFVKNWVEKFRLAKLKADVVENKTEEFVAHLSYSGGGWGLQDTEIPDRMKEPT